MKIINNCKVDFTQECGKLKPKKQFDGGKYISENHKGVLSLPDQEKNIYVYATFMNYKREYRAKLYLESRGGTSVTKSTSAEDMFHKVDLIAHYKDRRHFIQVKRHLQQMTQPELDKFMNYCRKHNAVPTFINVVNKLVYLRY